MKQYKDIILHGASLFRQLKASHPNGSQAGVSIAVAGSGARRALMERAVAGGGGDDYVSSLANDLSSMLGGANEYLEQCGIDASDMTNKAISAYIMYGPGLNLDNINNRDNFDPSSIPSLKDVAPILLAFKEDDEEDCTAEDIAKQVLASKNYLQCSGVAGEVFDLENPDLELELQRTLQNVGDACGSAFESLLSLGGDLPDDFFNEDSDIGKSTKLCLKSVLGDNLIGNLIRYEYKNLDKVLGCTKSYSEELPRCVMSAPIEGGTTFSLPLSLYKKLYCLIGATSDAAIKGICTSLYEMLDEYLPEKGAATDVHDPNDSQFLGIDISVITGDELPAYCSKIYEDQGMDGAGLQSRFEYYNVHREYGWTVESGSMTASARDWEDGEATREDASAKTHNGFLTEDQGMDGVGLQSRFEYYNAHREHGWTIEPSSTSPQAKAEFAAVSVAASATTSWAAAPLAASARNREDGETTPETPPTKTKTAYLIAGGVGLAVLAVAAVAFYLRPKKTGGPGYSFVSRAFGNTLV